MSTSENLLTPHLLFFAWWRYRSVIGSGDRARGADLRDGAAAK